MDVKNRNLELILRILSGVGALSCTSVSALGIAFIYSAATDTHASGLIVYTSSLSTGALLYLAYELGKYTITERN